MNHKKRSHPTCVDINIWSFLQIRFFWRIVRNRGRYHPAVSNTKTGRLADRELCEHKYSWFDWTMCHKCQMCHWSENVPIWDKCATYGSPDCHQSVRACAIGLKISRESSMCATPPLFAYYTREVILGRGWHNSCYKTSCTSASIWDTAFILSLFDR